MSELRYLAEAFSQLEARAECMRAERDQLRAALDAANARIRTLETSLEFAESAASQTRDNERVWRDQYAQANAKIRTLDAENERLREALSDIAGRWDDVDASEHDGHHDPDACEVVICVAKRALARTADKQDGDGNG